MRKTKIEKYIIKPAKCCSGHPDGECISPLPNYHIDFKMNCTSDFLFAIDSIYK